MLGTSKRATGRAAIALALFTAALIEFTTDTPNLGPFYGLLGPPGTNTSVTAGILLILVATLAMVFGRSASVEDEGVAFIGPRFERVLRLAPAVALASSLFWTRRLIPPSHGLLWNAFVVVSAAGFIVLALARTPVLTTVAWGIGVGLVIRIIHFRTFAMDVGADMLPLVRSALASFFQGHSPYALHHVPLPLPLTYYPLTWLAYAPVAALGLDLRSVNVIAELAILGALWLVARRTPRAAVCGSATALLWTTVFVLPSSIYFDRITTAPVAWAAVAWLLATLSIGSRFAWLALGLALATTPLTTVFVPIAGLTWFRQWGAKKTLAFLVGAALVAALIVTPFVVWAPRDFYEGTVAWFNDLDKFPRTKWKLYRTWRRYIGVSSWLWERGLEQFLKPIQAVLVLTVAALFTTRGRSQMNGVAMFAAASFLLFMAFNPVLWPYFNQPALVALLVAVAASERVTPAPAPPAAEFPA